MISLRFRPAESADDWTTAVFLGEAESLAAQALIDVLGDFVVQARRGSAFREWAGVEEFDFENEGEEE